MDQPAASAGPVAPAPGRPGPPDDRPGAIAGLLIDWGGVMTSNMLGTFASFCAAEGLDPHTLALAFRGDDSARQLLVDFEEGRIEEPDFESGLGRLLGLRSHAGLVGKIFSGARTEPSMVSAVLGIRNSGIPTGLISNSWGTTRYPRDLLSELFDAVILSGEAGIRKPNPEIYRLGADAIGIPPEQCVFVDDLTFNLPPAENLGMTVIHHKTPDETIPQLEALLGISPLGESA